MTNQLLNTAIEAAIEAGKEILKIYQTADFEVEFKADDSPLTKADKAAHHIIVEHLSKTNFPILSEEGKHIDYTERAKWSTFWLVDPLDGTKEFIKRNGEFTVNIALIDQQSPILGVVYVPVTGEIYFADHSGTFKALLTEPFNDGLIAAIKLPTQDENQEFVVVGSRSHMSSETKEFIDKLDKKGKSLKLISKGSSLKLCQVAEGTADCYPRLGPTMEWDTAAGHAIAKFAGKSVNIYPDNTPLIYNKENLLNPWFIVK